MEIIKTAQLIQQSFLSPIVLTFFFGMAAKLIHSDLKFPKSIHQIMGTYFLLSVSINAGTILNGFPFSKLILPVLAAVVTGLCVVAYSVLTARHLGQYGPAYAGLISTHTGFLSIVAIYNAMNWLDELKVPYHSYFPVLVVCAELTSIIASLMFTNWRCSMSATIQPIIAQTLNGKSLLLIAGGVIIGIACQEAGYASVKPFFYDPLAGVTCLLMMHLGMEAGKHFADFANWKFMQVVVIGMLSPLLLGCIGLLISRIVGMQEGDRVLMGVLAACSSYFAAALTVHVTYPRFEPDLNQSVSLSIMLPFFLSIGLPVLFSLSALI